MVAILRRPGRVTCTKCGASHPAIYNGQRCLICGSTIAASGPRKDAGAKVIEMTKAKKAEKAEKQYKTQLAALQSERDELRAALQASRTPQDSRYVSEYEWYVELAAKGLAQRDNYPMPNSVTTPEDFYKVMATAALDAMGLRALLERVAQVEPGLE